MEQQMQQQQKDMLELRKQLRRNNTRTLRAILGAAALIAAALVLQSPLLHG
jgi:ubiquinone biosynthesis protein